MRILCLYFSEPIEKKLAEAFLVLSPLVVFRPDQWIFINIDSTSHLHGGESKTMQLAIEICRRLHLKDGLQVQAAIAKTAYLAQALAKHQPGCITENKQDLDRIKRLPLAAILDLEGLQPWPKPRQLENMIQFFNNLGLHEIQDTQGFQAESFRQRWGLLGITLWKRLHLVENQPISPLYSKEPFIDYHFYEFSISNTEMLMHTMEALTGRLFARLEGLGRFAKQMQVYLHCEFSNLQHKVLIEPVVASRDQKLFLDLFLKKIEKLDMDNPIKELEVHILDTAEKILQLDMFEPRDSAKDKWQRLVSFAKQADIKMGFLQMTAEHFPEDSFFLKTDLPETLNIEDKIAHEADAIQVKAAYSKMLSKSPRPSLILPMPRKISANEIKNFRFLTSLPMERLAATWWRKENRHTGRDYFFVLTKKNQILWIFKDHISGDFFEHGAFD